jgi:hypothetical protein
LSLLLTKRAMVMRNMLTKMLWMAGVALREWKSIRAPVLPSYADSLFQRVR